MKLLGERGGRRREVEEGDVGIGFPLIIQKLY